MKYLGLAYGDQGKMGALSTEELKSIGDACKPYNEEFKKTGRVVVDEGLDWATTSLVPRKGTVAVTDGPFVETKEQVGGVFIIEARDLNEAIQVASLHPAAHLGEQLGWGIELRPLAVFD